MEIRTLVRLLNTIDRDAGLRWIKEHDKEAYWSGDIHAWFSSTFYKDYDQNVNREHEIPVRIYKYIVPETTGDSMCKRFDSKKTAIDALIQALHDAGEI